MTLEQAIEKTASKLALRAHDRAQAGYADAWIDIGTDTAALVLGTIYDEFVNVVFEQLVERINDLHAVYRVMEKREAGK